VVWVPLGAQRLFDLAVDVIVFFDRRRRIRECSECGGTLSSARRAGGASYYEAEKLWKRGVAGPQICPPGEWMPDRFRSGAALMEAFASQLSELRALPTIEPHAS
jgi:hypothetical protein